MRGPSFALVAAAIAAAAGVALAAGQADATFKGRNGLIVYQAQTGQHIQLFSVRPDGTGRRQLTNLTDSDAIQALWSPDGTKLVFTRKRGPNKTALYTMNADGSGLHALGPHIRREAAWLPDSKHLLVLYDLKWTIVTATGTGPRFAGIPGSGSSPCVEPDGRHVAMFASLGRTDGLEAIFVAAIGGGVKNLKRVTPWGKFADKLDCSPDGTKIAFSKPDFGPPASANVYVMKIDGTGLKQLTHANGGTINDGLDSWSPDGHKIAYVSNRDGQYQIYSMNEDGTGDAELTHGTEAHAASWGSHP